MAKSDLGTKRVCPETGRKFYDLNKDPIVSPYTGKAYPLTFFEDTAAVKVMESEEEEDVVEVDAENADAPVGTSDADAAGDDNGDDIPDIEDEEDVEIDDAGDTFLEEDEDDEDDMSNLIGGVSDEDEET